MATFRTNGFLANTINSAVQSQVVAASRPLALNAATSALKGTVISFMGATLLGTPGVLAAGALLGIGQALSNRAAFKAGAISQPVVAASAFTEEPAARV